MESPENNSMDGRPNGRRILAWSGGPTDPERFVALGGVRLPEPADPTALSRALDATVARHPVLGTGPVQLSVVDDVWEAVAAGRYPADAQCLLWAFLAGRDLLLVAQHTVADPWSMRLLSRDVMSPGTGPAPTYHGQNDTNRQARTARAVPYWRTVLADVPALAPVSGDTVELQVPTGIAEADVAAVARQVRSTSFVVLLAAFAQALDTGEDLLLPVLTHGRHRAEWDIVELFMNVLPVRIAGRELGAVHRAFVEAYAHEIPFPVLLDLVPAADRVFGVGGPALAQFEVIQVPDPQEYVPLTRPPGLGLGGPLLPVNGLAFGLELGADRTYTACVWHRRSYGEAAVRDLVRQFTERWEAICADARGA